jgi:hypothetical protein
MESTSVVSRIIGDNGSYIFVGLLVVAVLVGLGYFVLGLRSNTMPVLTPFQDMPSKKKEGFYGGVAQGAGIPDCLRTSSEAAELHGMFAGRVDSVEEGKGDFSEFTILLSQLACFKKDLMGVAQQVEATRYQPFATQIDLEPIAETTARCFAKTIPKRDIELAFEKWSKRGHFLIVRLCTAAGLSEAELVQADTLFKKLIADVQDVAMDRCLTGTPTITAEPASPRDPVPHSSNDITGRDYNGYY